MVYFISNDPRYDEWLVRGLQGKYDVKRLSPRRSRWATAVRNARLRVILNSFSVSLQLLRQFPSRRTDAVFVARSYHYAVLVIARIRSLVKARTPVYLFNFYLHSLGRSRFVRSILRQLLRGDVGILVHSPHEVSWFKELAPHAVVEHYPYCLGSIRDLPQDEIEDGGFVFAGGYTNRDYDTLLRTATLMPDARFLIACSRLNVFTVAVPSNVEIHHDLGYRDFHRAMARSSVVVVPLLEDVGSSGQMVVLAGMHLGKPVVVPPLACVGQYFDEETAAVQYQRGNPGDLALQLQSLLCDADRRHALGVAARMRVREHFSRKAYQEQVLERAGEFLERFPALARRSSGAPHSGGEVVREASAPGSQTLE